MRPCALRKLAVLAIAVATPAVLAAAEPPRARLLGGGGESVFGEARRHVGRRCADDLGDRLRLGSSACMAALARYSASALSISRSRATMKSLSFRPRPRSTHDRVEGRRALFGDVGRGEDRLAARRLDLGQHRVPTNSPSMSPRSQAASIPGGRMFRICRSLGGDAGFVERVGQLIMRGRDKGVAIFLPLRPARPATPDFPRRRAVRRC